MGNPYNLANVEFDIEAVEAWIEIGWLSPPQNDGGELSEIDLARAHLIHDLKHNLGVNDDGVPIILDLIDQLHGLRRAMRALLEQRRM